MATHHERPPRLSRTAARDRNRRALLAAAAEAVAEHGLEDMQLVDVAERAGLTKGAIYSIFGSKRDLVIALIRDLFAADATSHLDATVDVAHPPSESLRRHAGAFEALLRRRKTASVLRLEIDLLALSVRDPRVLEVVAEERERRTARLAEGLGSEALARSLLALEQGWALAVALGERPPRGELAAAAAALAVD